MSLIQKLSERYTKHTNPDVATTVAQSLIQLSSGIYTEEERFVFELLQNAVDAFNYVNTELKIKIILWNNYLVFLHNGEQFSDRDIEGLCDIGNGNKISDTKKIGYKGIGFKSVFMCSTCVIVQTGTNIFKFDKDVWKNFWETHWTKSYGNKDDNKTYLMPWQIIPIETTRPIEVDTKGYNVITYIRVNTPQTIQQKISKLIKNSQFLLFLKTQDIHFEFEVNGNSEACITKSTKGNIVELHSKGVLESKWLLHTNENVKVSPSLRESINADINTPQKLKDTKSFDLSFAIALDINKVNKIRKIEGDEAVVYTYLPTSFKFGTEGFPFLVNANFITDAGRQQLHKDSEWNKLIFSKIPSEYLSFIKKISSKYSNYYEVLPKISYGSNNELERVFEKELGKAISTIPFIPQKSDSEMKLMAHSAFMDYIGISGAISIEALVSHINRTYHKSFDSQNQIENIWNRKESKRLEDYGVFVFDKQKLESLFDDKMAFKDVNADLNIKLIDFLFQHYLQNKSEQEELIQILQSTPFLLDENNMLCQPVELFFPSSYKEQNNLANNAKILHAKIYEAISANKACYDWLYKIGVQELDDITFIKTELCKSDYVNKDNTFEVARFLFKVSKKCNLFEEISLFELGKIKFITKKGTLKEANDLYLGEKYKPTINIEPVFDGDIYISEQYPTGDNYAEWSVFFIKIGILESLEIQNINISETKGFSLLETLKNKFGKEYNIGSWGTHFMYSFKHFCLYYAPFVLTDNCSKDFLKIIWTTALRIEYNEHSDKVEGSAGYWAATRTFSDLNESNFLPWAFNYIQKFPSTDGQLLLSKDLFQNTENIKNIAGKYLPVIDIDCEIHESWLPLMNMRNQLQMDDLLHILTNISIDIESISENKERIWKIYQRLVEFDTLISESKKRRIQEWASNNKILSKDDVFVAPSELSHITLDGFSQKNRVYIGEPSNRAKVIELLALMGVTLITEKSITPKFSKKEESNILKNILLERISALTLIACGEEVTQEDYSSKKKALKELLEDTHFYHCDSIQLGYGNNEDNLQKTSFAHKNEFYYTGNLRPSNVELLLSPLCRFLEIKKKERELFILLIEDWDGIRENLKDKGYNVSLLEKPLVPMSDTIGIINTFQPTITQQDRNLITGFKGEIIVYERLKQMGYNPICLSITTKNDKDIDVKEIVVNGNKYYCKPNYGKFDISFTTHNGICAYVEVKATTCSRNQQENMPISFNELSMIEECDKKANKAYFIVRVFGIDQDKQDIYIFKGHLLNK